MRPLDDAEIRRLPHDRLFQDDAGVELDDFVRHTSEANFAHITGMNYKRKACRYLNDNALVACDVVMWSDARDFYTVNELLARAEVALRDAPLNSCRDVMYFVLDFIDPREGESSAKRRKR